MTYSLLCQLACALVLGVAQQFDNSALIRSQTGDFLDDLADEGGALAQMALGAADAWLGGNGGDFLNSVGKAMVSNMFRIGEDASNPIILILLVLLQQERSKVERAR